MTTDQCVLAIEVAADAAGLTHRLVGRFEDGTTAIIFRNRPLRAEVELGRKGFVQVEWSDDACVGGVAACQCLPTNDAIRSFINQTREFFLTGKFPAA